MHRLRSIVMIQAGRVSHEPAQHKANCDAL